MQQTKLDRWMREKFAYVTRVYSNTAPEKIPAGIKVEELDLQRGAPYRFRFSSTTPEKIDRLARQMEKKNITYTSRVEDRDVWYGKFINNPQKSFTYRIFWIGCIFAVVAFAFSPFPKMLWEYASSEDTEMVAK